MGRPNLHCWPLAVGLLGGLLGLWWRGGLLVLDGQPSGYQWPAWVYGAWSWRHGHLAHLDAFRDPLHSILVGLAGESLGYANAGILVAGFSMAVVLVAATHTATLLAGRYAGALTALTLPLSPLAASGTRWATAYPLLAAGLTASTAAAVHHARRPSLAALLVWGASTALASWADDRGILALATLPLVAMGIGGRTRRQQACRVAVILGAIALGQAGPACVGQSNSMSWSEKRGVQTRVVRRWTTQTMNTAMKAACEPVPEHLLITPQFLTTACAPAVLDHNRTHALPGITAWPGFMVLGGLLLLPLARRRRIALGYGIAVVISVLPIALFTPLPARYQVIFTGLLAPLVPVGLASTVPPRHRRWTPLLCIVALGLVWWADPHRHAQHPVQGIHARWKQPGERAQALGRVLQPADRILDCANAYVEVALLPHHIPSMGPHLSVPDTLPCHAWLATVPTRGAHILLLPQGTSEAQRKLLAAVRQSAHWDKVLMPELSGEGITVWRRDPR